MEVGPVETKRFLVTGGAGFIGSYIVERLTEEGDVQVVDNLSSGRREFISHLIEKDLVTFVKADLLTADMRKLIRGVDVVFHFAANPDVRAGATDPDLHFEQNVVATQKLLSASKGRIPDWVFASTSTVYGEATVVPTPEDYAPLAPISLYGASKLACEALLSAHVRSLGGRAIILRFANVVGGRSRHGVIFDFHRKLGKDPRRLEILGAEPGTFKSYVHVDDAVDATLLAWRACREEIGIYNVGSLDAISVKEIADMACGEMGLSKVAYRWTGGVRGGGWTGDVRRMQLSVERLLRLGWSPRMNSAQALRAVMRSLIQSRVEKL